MSKYYLKPNEKFGSIEEKLEVRPRVVQRILNYLQYELEHGRFSEFVPNYCWMQTNKIAYRIDSGHDEFVSRSNIFTYKNKESIRTNEMKKVVEVWINNGYFVGRKFVRVGRHTAIVYLFSNVPFTRYGYTQVNQFLDEIN